MGLTNTSVGRSAVDLGLHIQKRSPKDKVIAVAGNPNVGKSTIFNALTGMNQHTGNWPGKTVTSAQGYCETEHNTYVLVDIPGTYSLLAHSAEEEVARNFICFGKPDATVVVCDATCLERNLNLVLQILEVSPNTVVCVNLLDEAKRKNIHVDLQKLSELLGVPVVGTIAQKKKTLSALKSALDKVTAKNSPTKRQTISYPQAIEDAICPLETALRNCLHIEENTRWLALRLLDYDDSLIHEINHMFGKNILEEELITDALQAAHTRLQSAGIEQKNVKDIIISTVFREAEKISAEVVTVDGGKYHSFDRKIDRILTGKRFGYPLMLLLLICIFWLTISGANYPSELLSMGFAKLGEYFSALLTAWNTPPWLHSMLVDGIYKVLTWVISVMLPPMAIFFPLFTLLEDIGYLPRIAYNLDRPFQCCRACGKQALTMCMGFGCNAAGVVGCRIIDSPRERLIAILTNSLVPCNGRFPTLVALICMFFIGTSSGAIGSVLSALLLTLVILLGIGMTFLASKLLSLTVLKGVPSSFTLELPPYRKPQIGKVIVRSIFDRTLFVLGRSAAVAAPAGLVIWLAANLSVGDQSVLRICAEFLDPFAKLLGMDGVILIAFILGFPANEIVLPIIVMAYLSESSLVAFGSYAEMSTLLIQNGWTWVTAVCTMTFSMFHWPCSTTMLTIRKETGSLKWTALAAILPTAIGMILCALIAAVAKCI